LLSLILIAAVLGILLTIDLWIDSATVLVIDFAALMNWLTTTMHKVKSEIIIPTAIR